MLTGKAAGAATLQQKDDADLQGRPRVAPVAWFTTLASGESASHPSSPTTGLTVNISYSRSTVSHPTHRAFCRGSREAETPAEKEVTFFLLD